MIRIQICLFAFMSWQVNAAPIENIECEEYNEQAARNRNPNKVFSKDELLSLSFKFDVVGYGTEGRVVNTVDEIPVVAIKLKNGWLLGSDKGEWGGSLVHKSEAGEVTIISDNIEDIYEYDFGYIVVAGLSHMGLNSGSIYLVTETEKRNFKSIKLHGLPSAPRASWMLENRSVLINFYKEPSIIFTSKGLLKRVQCTNIENRNN